jgi:single-stranded DNA-binding protein
MVLTGRLARDPESKVFEDSQRLVANTTIFLDPAQTPQGRSAPIRISAWEELAKELCKYRKGHIIHVIASASAGVFKLDREDENSKTLAVTDATVRAVLTENQAIDLKRALFEQAREMEGVVMDTFAQSGSEQEPPDEHISFDEPPPSQPSESPL